MERYLLVNCLIHIVFYIYTHTNTYVHILPMFSNASAMTIRFQICDNLERQQQQHDHSLNEMKIANEIENEMQESM